LVLLLVYGLLIMGCSAAPTADAYNAAFNEYAAAENNARQVLNREFGGKTVLQSRGNTEGLRELETAVQGVVSRGQVLTSLPAGSDTRYVRAHAAFVEVVRAGTAFWTANLAVFTQMTNGDLAAFERNRDELSRLDALDLLSALQ
jgi:hypothetical protein